MESTEQLLARVRGEVQRLMKAHAIPGMAVGITHGGRQLFFNAGVAQRQNHQPVTERTIFEIGSISKTYTALLGGYALARGSITLADNASQHWPQLSGSAVGRASLLDLATYTAGGLPLQFPDGVTDYPSMLAYYKGWTPDYPPGTKRRYSNPSIGLFGLLVSMRLGRPFPALVQDELLQRLGMHDTFIDVPAQAMDRYAFGYTSAGKPIRVTPGMLDAQAYGIKTTAADLLRFVEAHIFRDRAEPLIRQGMDATLSSYYAVGPMQQGLGWEIYDGPPSLEQLLQGNSARIALESNAAVKLAAPSLQRNGLVNKSGSTNGFGAYVAFVPGKQVGVVMLANKNFPIAARVESAHRIINALI
jgi:beta-lactamase class C